MNSDTQASEPAEKEVTFVILRFDPDRDEKPSLKSYVFKARRGMTVLDGLMHIKETQDSTLSYRKSCRMGICGSCGMVVNGKPVLACQTQIAELRREVIHIRPLPNYPLIRDLVPDLSPLFERHERVKPYIIRADADELHNPSGEYRQTPQELERYLQFTYCIKCGCCVSACPTSSTDSHYTGPQALAQAYRYNADSRDGGSEERLAALDHPHGVWRCHFPGACSEACPKGVDPAFAIQLLKKDVMISSLGLKKGRSPAPLVPLPEGVEKKPDVPDAPPRTVSP